MILVCYSARYGDEHSGGLIEVKNIEVIFATVGGKFPPTFDI